MDAPQPTDVSQLRSFLGIVNYYNRFLPNLSSRLAPLHNLLRKDERWRWTQDCQEAFQGVKEMITSDVVLTHFDPEVPISLACDASSYGLGAVLSHVTQEGHDRPIAFASRTLNPAERGYSQIDKEALALVWGIRRFHQYLYGHRFILITDHQPLASIFHPERDYQSLLQLDSNDMPYSFLGTLTIFVIDQLHSTPMQMHYQDYP